jgi:hypothetical protein
VRRAQRTGNRYFAGLVMAFAMLHLIIGSLGPVRQSPYFVILVVLPALAAFILGGRAWSSTNGKWPGHSAAGLVILILAQVLWRLNSGTFG